MKKNKLGMNQLETILNLLQLNSNEVLPKIATNPTTDSRERWIENFKVDFISEKDKIALIISGTYIQYWHASYKESGLWQPSKPTKTVFNYKKIIKP